jgi:FAD/FMN-containing dehydrogenase
MKVKDFIDIIKAEFPEDRLTYQKTVATFHPESAVETSSLFLLADKYRQPLFITGFGNNIDPAGDIFQSLIAVRTDRLNDLIKVIPEDFYIVVGAGYPLEEINENLAEYGLFLPHSDLPYAGSVGGALAVGLAAQHGPHILPIGRYLVMAEIAMPQGEIIKPGSACFKSVSGLDIVKIFSPSWGLLGLIASATFRVLPLSLKDEYTDLVMRPIEYRPILDIYNNPRDNISGQYSIKIKRKFDPNNILPLINIYS